MTAKKNDFLGKTPGKRRRKPRYRGAAALRAHGKSGGVWRPTLRARGSLGPTRRETPPARAHSHMGAQLERRNSCSSHASAGRLQ